MTGATAFDYPSHIYTPLFQPECCSLIVCAVVIQWHRIFYLKHINTGHHSGHPDRSIAILQDACGLECYEYSYAYYEEYWYCSNAIQWWSYLLGCRGACIVFDIFKTDMLMSSLCDSFFKKIILGFLWDSLLTGNILNFPRQSFNTNHWGFSGTMFYNGKLGIFYDHVFS